MRKQCRFLSILGLTAMMGLMASQARAETMTLTVYAGSGTGGAVVYTTTGGANSVTADTSTAAGNLNDQLAAAGLGAYTFSNLGGSSNFTSSAALEQHILVSGAMTVTSGGSGESTPFTIVVSEDGFTQPPIGKTLSDGATASFGASTGSSANTGTYSGVPSSVSPSTLTETSSPPFSSASAPITSSPIPYTLASQSIITLDSATAGSTGTLGFTNQVTVAGFIPEPASVVMMLTGMPLPLVVLGILRRRRAAA
jgi:hypothetical protein